MSPDELYAKAVAAAKKAVEDMGPEDTLGLNCGFAWATVRPARGPFITWCKKNGLGKPGWSGGWYFWNPGKFPGQQVDHIYAGAKAFAEVLIKEGGLVVETGSRLD